jgi:hypothetical protein
VWCHCTNNGSTSVPNVHSVRPFDRRLAWSPREASQCRPGSAPPVLGARRGASAGAPGTRTGSICSRHTERPASLRRAPRGRPSCRGLAAAAPGRLGQLLTRRRRGCCRQRQASWSAAASRFADRRCCRAITVGRSHRNADRSACELARGGYIAIRRKDKMFQITLEHGHCCACDFT